MVEDSIQKIRDLSEWRKEDGYSPDLEGFFKIKGEEEFLAWISENGWNGQGREDDPYIIDNLGEEFEKLYIYKVNHYVKIKDVNTKILDIEYCKNIEIIDSKFRVLNLGKDPGLKFRNIDVITLMLSNTNKCTFENCQIQRVINSFSFANTFSNCDLTPDAMTGLSKNYFNVLRIMMIAPLSLIVIIPLAIRYFFFDLFSAVLFLAVLGFILIGYINVVLHMHKIKKNPNKII